MSKKLRQSTKSNTSHQNSGTPNAATGSDREAADLMAAKQRLASLIGQGDYERALHSMTASGRANQFPNEKAVCLMRLGRNSEAVTTLRKIVLGSNCAWTRDDVPLLHKINFATALLLDGHASGCKSVLHEISDESLPAVARIRSTIRQWEKTMSLWQRLNWRWLGIDPNNRPVQFDGLPGELELPIVSLPSTKSAEVPGACLKTAV